MFEVTRTDTGFAEVNGARLYYEVAGEGHPLVLIHGGVMDRRMWDDQFSVLAQHYRVIRYDVRSSGNSTNSGNEFSFLEDLHGLLSHLGHGSAYLLGSGGGSVIAIDFALSYPDKVDALILASPRVTGHTWSEELLRKHEPLNAALKEGDIARAIELRLQIWIDGPMRTAEQVNPAFRERIRDMMMYNYKVDSLSHAWGKLRKLEPLAIYRLTELRAPALLVVGDQDEREALGLADMMEAHISGARNAVLHGSCSTAVNMEQPENFNQIVLDFLHSL